MTHHYTLAPGDLRFLVKRAYALRHIHNALAPARPIPGHILRPGIDFTACDVIPGAQFPGAKTHFFQTRIE